MSKYRLINLIDKLFITIAIFLIIYAWINFYIRSLWATFAISIVLTFAIVYVLYFFLNKKQTNLSISKKHNEEINNNFLAFKLTGKTEKYKLINSILQKEYETKLTRNKLTYIKENKIHLVLIYTNFLTLTENDLINILDENNVNCYNEIDLICEGFAINLNTKILKDVKINLINKQKLYDEYFFKFNIYPDDSKIEKGATKLKFKDVLKGFFTANKAKGYFLCGLILIFSAIILPYHYYYLIFGSMLLLFAVVCKILPKLNFK